MKYTQAQNTHILSIQNIRHLIYFIILLQHIINSSTMNVIKGLKKSGIFD